MSEKTLWIIAGIVVFLILTVMAGPLFAVAAFIAGGVLAWFFLKINND